MPNYRVDVGHRFIEPKTQDAPFTCPKCGGPAREDDWALRLGDSRSESPWESVPTRVPAAKADAERATQLCTALRASDRVKRSAKKLSDLALLERYGLVDGEALTNLGVLLVGARHERARIGGVLQSELATGLALADDELSEWLGRLEELGIVELIRPGPRRLPPDLPEPHAPARRRLPQRVHAGLEAEGTPGRREGPKPGK